jgi:hypothetical protein
MPEHQSKHMPTKPKIRKILNFFRRGGRRNPWR